MRTEWMQEYPKIQSLYKRGGAGEMLFGQWSTPELEWLSGCEWLWTEKVDGTNIRVGWEPFHGNVRLGGRTNNAQLPSGLRRHLEATFTPGRLEAAGLSERTTLYGEGYGTGIQKGGGDYGPVSFILFDVVVDGWWLRPDDMRDVAGALGIRSVPAVGSGPLWEMEAAVKAGLRSALYANGREPEGLVARTPYGLADRAGRPLLAKIKARDFAAR